MSKYNYEYNENDYKTPPELYEKALKKFGLVGFFTIDVCCSEHNIPALSYYVNGEQNGLKEPWFGFCWCNPPFNECKKWVKKAYKENQQGACVAMLIPARTETAYFHDYILNNPNVEIEFLRKGYRFLNKENKQMGVFKNALALVYFR